MTPHFEDNSTQVVTLFYKTQPQLPRSDQKYIPLREDPIIQKISIEDSEFTSPTDYEIFELPISSENHHYLAELEDTSKIAITPGKNVSIDSAMQKWASQPDSMYLQPFNKSQISVENVFDQTIAVIEASNRELILRIKAAEESTRALQEQNLDLKRTISEFNRQKLGRSGSVSSINLSNDSNVCHTNQNQRVNSHSRKSPSLSASMQAKISNDFFDINPVKCHSRFKSSSHAIRSGIQTANSDFNNTSSNSDSLWPPFFHSHAEKTRISSRLLRKGSRSDLMVNTNTTTTTTNNNKPLPSISPFYIDSKLESQSLSSSLIDPKLEPLCSNPISSISGPLPGSIRHYQIVFDGFKFSNNTRPSIISLEEAQKRAKISSPAQTSPDLNTNSDNFNSMIEGTMKKSSLDTSSPELGAGCFEVSTRAEKKKGRFQDFIKGRRHS